MTMNYSNKARQECSQDLQTFMIYKKKKVYVYLYYLSKEILLYKDQGDLFPELTIDITFPATFGQNPKNPSQLDIASSNVQATYGSMLDVGMGGLGNIGSKVGEGIGNIGIGKGFGEGLGKGIVNATKREFKFKAASEEKVKEWLLHLNNSQNGNPTPEQRKQKAQEMILMKELKEKKARERGVDPNAPIPIQGLQPGRPTQPHPNQPGSPRTPRSQAAMQQQQGGNVPRSNSEQQFIPVGGTLRGNPTGQQGFQSGTIKGNPSRERNAKRTGKAMELFAEGGQSESPRPGQPAYGSTGGVYGYGGMGGAGKGDQAQDKSKAGHGTSSEEEQSAFIKRIKNFKKFGCESIESPAEFRQRIAAVYNQFDKERDKTNMEHFHELTMDAVFSLSGIILRCYLVDDTSGKWNWKVETNPLLPIILDSFEEIYLSEPGDQTFVLLQTDVNILMVRYQADTKKWALVLAQGDEPNIAFNTADMLNVTFPWSTVYSTVSGGLPKKVILNIEQQVRPRLPMEPLQQERVQQLVTLFDSISSIVVQLVKCYKSLPRIHALEDIRAFTDNVTIGPLVYDTLIPALIELMMDCFDTWTLFGVHHFWDYVVACTTEVAVHDHVMLLFNSTVSKIQNARFVVAEGQDVNVIRSRAFFCLALTYNQLSKWLGILFANEKQTARFYKSNALWRTSYTEIVELLKLLDGIPFQLTGLPPSKTESEEAMVSWFEQAKAEIAQQARAVLEVQLAEYGYELPKIESEIELSKLTFEADVNKEYDELVQKVNSTYTELEPDLLAAKEAFMSGAENLFNNITEFFDDEDAYF